MRRKKRFLAMDFGSGSGRGMVGSFDGERLELEEVNRFPNYFVSVGNRFYWDVFRMQQKILETSQRVMALYPGEETYSLGIDTWGTDYGLLDAEGGLLGSPECIRNTKGEGRRYVEKQIPREKLFAMTGSQSIDGNTLYQLCERKLRQDPALDHADCLLMLPDLLAYFLTGEKKTEYTIASTSMLMDPCTRDWNTELMKSLQLPIHCLREIQLPCRNRRPVINSLFKEKEKWFVADVAGHDTGSAVSAAPLKEGELFISSGTWSILGQESDIPYLDRKVGQANFSNEGCPDGGYRLIKNCMGMWAMQQCKKEWEIMGISDDWDQIVEKARKSQPFDSLVNLEEPQFYNAGDMIPKIQNYCRQSGQPVPTEVGTIARCIYESMAMRYNKIIRELAEVTGNSCRSLRIVGGGSHNAFLNQMVADCLGIPVLAGPSEASSIGNVLGQAMAAGMLRNQKELREVVERSFASQIFEPRIDQKEGWEEAQERYQQLCLER